MTKEQANALLARIDKMRGLIAAATQPSTEEHGEMATISAAEFGWEFDRMEDTIRYASETPEERKARVEEEEYNGAEADAAYYNAMRQEESDSY